MKKSLLSIAMLLAFVLTKNTMHAVTRAQLNSYYASLKGLKKEALKTKLHELLKNHKQLKYGGGNNGTWDAFYSTDRIGENEVRNRYSTAKFYFANGHDKQSVAGMNIEHSFPKSWWGKTKNAANVDIHHLYPSPSKDNGQKSNHPMGHVTNVQHDSGAGFDKVGTGEIDGQIVMMWEPGDGWKGDFSRTYMYMAVCYQDLTWQKTGLLTCQTGAYPTLKQWASTLYRAWNKQDKVDNIETQRNDAVYQIQQNRNPFIDYPFLSEYIWGDSINVEFDPSKTITTASDDARYSNFTPSPAPSPVDGEDNNPSTPVEDGVIYDAQMEQNNQNFEKQVVKMPQGGKFVWTYDNKRHHFKASGFFNKTKHEMEGMLTTPEIDLRNVSNLMLRFKHSLNHGNNTGLKLEVIVDGQKEELTIAKWGTGTNYDFVEAGDISLEKYAGKKIKLMFCYVSTMDNCPTWQIKDLKIMGTRSTNGVEELTTERVSAPDFTKPYQMFTVNGLRIDANNTSYKGVVIVKQGAKTWKKVRR